MKKNKKALTQSMIVKVILAIIVLVYLLTIFNSYTKVAEIKSKELGCSLFFSDINSGEKYFTKTNDVPSQLFSTSIIETCPSKSVDVSKRSVDQAVDWINSCFNMAGSGKDILENTNMKDQAICLYCGEIKTEENIENFNELLSKKLKLKTSLFENTGYINTNKYFLDEKYLPKEISEEKPLSIFYYIYRPDYGEVTDFETGAFDPISGTEFTLNYHREWLSSFSNNIGFVGELAADLAITPDIQSIGGIVLSEQNELTNENLLDEKVSIKGPFGKCTLYVPLTHLD